MTRLPNLDPNTTVDIDEKRALPASSDSQNEAKKSSVTTTTVSDQMSTSSGARHTTSPGYQYKVWDLVAAATMEPEDIPLPGTPSSDSSSDFQDGEDSGMVNENSLENLRNGFIKASDSNEYTILLVGETGVGKTSVLDLIVNVLTGHRPDEYIGAHDQSNEAGGSQSQSQTNSAIVYEYMSRNGVKIRIVDTPGLADKRGLEQDQQHKASIAKAIRDHIVSVNGVLILANGTNPRLGVATDYALTTLTSIFPRTLSDNIAILFTNVASPLSWNFEEECLPPVLRNVHQFTLDNPVAMQKKYDKMKLKIKSDRMLAMLHKSVEQGEQSALTTLVDLFDWLQDCEPQPTRDILTLYEQTQTIEKSVQNALARMHQAKGKKDDLEKIRNDIEKAKLDCNTFRRFEKIMKRKYHKQINKSYHSTLCCEADCYRNCHEGCSLVFTLDPKALQWCAAMHPWRTVCSKCGHASDNHRHYNALWEEVEEDEHIVDEQAKKKYKEAQNEVEKKEVLQDLCEKTIDELTKEISKATMELGSLAEQYAALSLSGSFSSQVKKAHDVLKLKIEAMRTDGTDPEMVAKMERSASHLEEKLIVLMEAKRARKSSILQSDIPFGKSVWKALRKMVES